MPAGALALRLLGPAAKAAKGLLLPGLAVAGAAYPFSGAITEYATGEKAAEREALLKQVEGERGGKEGYLKYLLAQGEADREADLRREGIATKMGEAELGLRSRQVDQEGALGRAGVIAQVGAGGMSNPYAGAGESLTRQAEQAQMEINYRLANGMPINPWLAMGLNVG